MREQLEGEGAGDFRNLGVAEDDLFQEGGLLAGGAGGAVGGEYSASGVSSADCYSE